MWFFDEPRFLANTPPFYTPVDRPIRAELPHATLLNQLYAGPTPAETARGLRLVLSGSTGFQRVTVSDFTARVRLAGGCSSNGSTVTVAGEIFPTLRQLSTVDAVKILDPAGHTEHPTGRTDSIPTCLEP